MKNKLFQNIGKNHCKKKLHFFARKCQCEWSRYYSIEINDIFSKASVEIPNDIMENLKEWRSKHSKFRL